MSRVKKFEGFFTNDTALAIHDVPSEASCGYFCLRDDGCKAFFYDNSTLLCKPEQECRLVTGAYALAKIYAPTKNRTAR